MKTISLLFLGLLMTISILAQTSLQWEEVIGGDGSETARSAIQTPDGGYIIVGSTDSEGSGKLDGYAIKINGQGRQDWSQTFGGKKDDEFYAITEINGNYAIAGYSASKGKGKKDFWLMVIDKDGTKLWEHFYGGAKDEEAYDIIKTFDGNLVLAGYTKSKGPKKHNSWIIKVNSNGSGKKQGAVIWKRIAGKNGTDLTLRIKQNPQDSFIYAIGHTTSYGAGGMDMFFLKISNERGSAKAKKAFGKVAFEHGNDFCFLPDNNYLLVGSTRTNSKGYFDGWMLQIEKDYYKVWEKQYGDIKNEEYVSVFKHGDGFVLGGFSESFGEGKNDAWIMQIDKRGNIISKNTFGAEGNDMIYRMIKTKDGGYLMLGSTTSKGDGKKSMWIVKVN